MVEITHAMATDILHSTGSCVKIHYEPLTRPRTSRYNTMPSKMKKDSCAGIAPYQQRLVTFQRPKGEDECKIIGYVFCRIR